jgi:hypothetical protein
LLDDLINEAVPTIEYVAQAELLKISVGWLLSSLFTGLSTRETAPQRELYTHSVGSILADLFKESVAHTELHNPKKYFNVAFRVIVQLFNCSVSTTEFVEQMFHSSPKFHCSSSSVITPSSHSAPNKLCNRNIIIITYEIKRGGLQN